MRFETTYKLEDFILNIRWEDLPEEVKERIKGCFLRHGHSSNACDKNQEIIATSGSCELQLPLAFYTE